MVTPMGTLVHPIDYDWCPKYCFSYLKFGHWKKDYWNKTKIKVEEGQFHEVPR